MDGMDGMVRSRYDAKPWLALYGDVPAQVSPAVPTALDLFRRAVGTAPAASALAYFDESLSYREVDELSDGIAAYLHEQGFGRGDRLALYLQNVPQFVLGLIATWKLGGIVVPVNPMYRERELAHVLADAGVRALICSEHAWISPAAEVTARFGVQIVLTTSELDLQSRGDQRVLAGIERARPPGGTDLLEVARAGGAVPAMELTGADLALICYTSGTSGEPKGATTTHANLATNAAVMDAWTSLPTGSSIFALAPLFHITGLAFEVIFAISGTRPLVLTYRFDPAVALEAFVEHRPAFMVGPSTAYMALMAAPAATPESFASFDLLISGGAPVPPAVVEQFQARFGHYVHNGYGLTETTAPCVLVPVGRVAPVDPASGTLSVGVPVPGAVLRILDEAGAEVPIGEAGEIAVEGPMVVPGYWEKPAETAATIPGGRLLTGDIGFLDADGWCYVVDRKKDMINAAGFKVWPREVEDVLYTHPAVREAGVVGVPDAYRGETVQAYVSLHAGQVVTEVELIAYCRERMAAYKYPRHIEVLADLPKTVSGKILRRELRSAAGG
jgi:long-chain acyl-CoA synthetase